ncbi:spermatid perinuclear RNA-binding protein-like [Styela clava]
MRKPLADKVTITPDETNNIISIRPEKSECPYPIVISFTSPEYSPEYQSTLPEDTTEEQVPSKEFLNEEKCMEALAKIRRVRWSLRKIRAEIELPVVRILLDLREAYSGWKHLSPYAAEVLVHLVMEKLAKDVRESELSFSRLFIQCLEVLAEGMALRGGPGMKDPCEAKPVDVFSYLEPQHAEDLTRGAQNALRLASFGRLKELLKMDS